MIRENVGCVKGVRHSPRMCEDWAPAATTSGRVALNPHSFHRMATRAKTTDAKRGKGSPGTKAHNAKVRFGPAGWMYKDWEGIVYPQPKPAKFDQLRYIADFFGTVEINSSF